MPVILDPADYDHWLDPATSIDELRALLKPYPAELMHAVAVNRAVNSVKNDNEDCITPIGETPL
jgi:putative SOS response-associated peptidase YedK